VQGVEGCLPEVPTVGETYAISFVLIPLDAASSPITLKRYVTVAPACPPGERLCGVSEVCSPVPCEMLPDLDGGATEVANHLPADTFIQLFGPLTMQARAKPVTALYFACIDRH
jgi:hypothetical protein